MGMRIHKSDRLIQFYQVGVFYCCQAYRDARQSKKINFILWYPDKIDKNVFAKFRHTQSSQCCIYFFVLKGYLNFSLQFCWLRWQIVVYLEQSQNTFFIPVLLTGAQLNLVSYLLFISVFDEVDITFWVRLTNSFLKNKLPSQKN